MTAGRLLLALLAITGFALPAAAAQPLSVRSSFRIGSSGSLLCSAEALTTAPALIDMFDRGYAMLCRDATAPVGQLYVLRERGPDPVGRLAAIRTERVACRPGQPAQMEGIGPVETLDCRLNSADVAYRVYLHRARGALYVAEGLGGYDSALRVGLRSLVADREVPGEIAIAITGAGDPAAFARAQASVLDPQRALAEAYRRNNEGSYAESSEYFAALTEGGTASVNRAEAVVNEALQRSNLGRYAEAESLFSQALAMAGADPVTARRVRNYEAMHLLNQGLADAALEQLDRPMPPIGSDDAIRNLVIDQPTAGQLSAESPGASRLRGQEGLTQADKARILDGQALQLRGTVLSLQHRDAEAVAPYREALTQLVAIRGDHIAATIWLRAQIYDDLAGLAEARGDPAEAERLYAAAVALLETDYPDSAALLSAKGRLAAYYARVGRTDQALALFRAIVASTAEGGGASPGLRRLLEPYFSLLAARSDDPAAVADIFTASQVLVRPGVAQTQAVLARELSGGSDEAARLFRQSVNLTRDVERGRIELSRLQGASVQSAATEARIAELQNLLGGWRRDQAATQAQLTQFPRYRVVSNGALAIADLQHLLRPGEAYYMMLTVGDRSYGIFVTEATARAFAIDLSPPEIERRVDALRQTIATIQNGQQVTIPFNLELAFGLYQSLFGPIAGEMSSVTHLVFDPDGAMMRLPANLLVTDHVAIDAYRARPARSGEGDFDFRGIAWLGRDRDISTAVSVRAFRDVRQAPPSRARAQYLGLGQNQPVGNTLPLGATSSGLGACGWPAAAWNRPISAAELVVAARATSGGQVGQAEILTGAAFSDTAILGRSDLAQFRIIHFATHGLTGAPRRDCPARPSLLTSFGGAGSDGLLSFREIFNLRLDADLIILSACDTASGASVAATEEAGLVSGGEFALDGLVRAFIGAGGRMVIASHWPVPDDYNATERLISGLFSAQPGTSTAAALRRAERALMDDANTSHPYYWAGFAVIGDGAAPVIRPTAPQVAAAH